MVHATDTSFTQRRVAHKERREPDARQIDADQVERAQGSGQRALQWLNDQLDKYPF